jgi:hypothetical protein
MNANYVYGRTPGGMGRTTGAALGAGVVGASAVQEILGYLGIGRIFDSSQRHGD